MNYSGLVGSAEAFGQAEVATWWDDVLREDPKSVPDWPLSFSLVQGPRPVASQSYPVADAAVRCVRLERALNICRISPLRAPLRTEIDLGIIDRCRVLWEDPFTDRIRRRRHD